MQATHCIYFNDTEGGTGAAALYFIYSHDVAVALLSAAVLISFFCLFDVCSLMQVVLCSYARVHNVVTIKKSPCKLKSGTGMRFCCIR